MTISAILQIVLATGLLNVWLLRAGSSTAYRGGSAQTLKDEFRAYGLPDAVFYTVGFLKVGSAVALLAGFLVPALIFPAAMLIAGLMIGALAMHVKVQDPAIKSMPATLMLLMSAGLAILRMI